MCKWFPFPYISIMAIPPNSLSTLPTRRRLFPEDEEGEQRLLDRIVETAVMDLNADVAAGVAVEPAFLAAMRDADAIADAAVDDDSTAALDGEDIEVDEALTYPGNGTAADPVDLTGGVDDVESPRTVRVHWLGAVPNEEERARFSEALNEMMDNDPGFAAAIAQDDVVLETVDEEASMVDSEQRFVDGAVAAMEAAEVAYMERESEYVDIRVLEAADEASRIDEFLGEERVNRLLRVAADLRRAGVQDEEMENQDPESPTVVARGLPPGLGEPPFAPMRPARPARGIPMQRSETVGVVQPPNEEELNRLEEQRDAERDAERTARLNCYFSMFCRHVLGFPPANLMVNPNDNVLENGAFFMRMLAQGAGIDRAIEDIIALLDEALIVISASREGLMMVRTNVIVRPVNPAVIRRQERNQARRRDRRNRRGRTGESSGGDVGNNNDI